MLPVYWLFVGDVPPQPVQEKIAESIPGSAEITAHAAPIKEYGYFMFLLIVLYLYPKYSFLLF